MRLVPPAHFVRVPALGLLLLSASFLASPVAPLRADAPAPAAAPTVNFIPNGNFETDSKGNGTPDGWGAARGGLSYEVEEGNHFVRLTSTEPGKMNLIYRQINIPDGVRALELTWKQRITGLKVGKQAWFDARIMMEWTDAAGTKVPGAPGAPYSRKDTAGWVDKSTQFLVPEGAKVLKFMPALFNVESGTFDLDNLDLHATDAAPLEDAAKANAAKQAEKTAKVTEQRQAKAAAVAGTDGSIVTNGDFETDKNADGWPDDWGHLKTGSWESENGNHFLRMTSANPGDMVLLYRSFDIPAGVKALQLNWKQRTSNLKVGKDAWFDARIMMNFKDANGHKLSGGPSAPYTRNDSAQWVDKTTSFLVPEGALSLEFMPTLFQVKSGTLDLDDISLKATDPAPLIAAAAVRAEDARKSFVAPEPANLAKWPRPLHVAGNKVLDDAGKEVWLQGVNVESLEFLVRGDHVMKSALVAVEDWKSNVVRLPVKEEYWFGKESTQKDGGAAYRELVDNVINLVANRGAYVLLDLHRFRAPKQVHVDFWKDAATRYKNNPAVLFDIFNEPHGTSWEIWRNGGFVEDKDAAADEDAFLTPEEKALNAKGFHSVGEQALVDAARATGAQNIIVAGGLDWAYDLSGIAKGFALDDKGGHGIIYATHIYAGKKDWQNKVLFLADKYPIIVSELGANTQKFTFIPASEQEDATTWVPAILGLIQKYHLHWTAFSLHPKSAPQLISDWNYTPTPEWGALAKRALAGEQFPAPDHSR